MSTGAKVGMSLIVMMVFIVAVYFGAFYDGEDPIRIQPSQPAAVPADPPRQPTQPDTSRDRRRLDDGARPDASTRIDDTPVHVGPRDADLPSGRGGARPADPSPVEPTGAGAEKSESAARAQPDPPAVVNPVTPPPAKAVAYTVRDGDTLSSIAQQWFGDANKWDLIEAANPGLDPMRMKIGQTINLPPREASRAPVRQPAGQTTTHTVRGGETLSDIARAYYQDVARWEDIYRANRRLIGASPNDLQVGMKLVIPAR